MRCTIERVLGTCVVALALTAGLHSSAHAQLVYGVTEDNRLITFDARNPTALLSNRPITGLLQPSELILGFDQNYFRAAREVEMAHYQLLMSALNNRPTPVTTFYFPQGMFNDAQVTLDTLVTLEEAFIAAYLVGVRDLSTPELKVTAARILAVESDHRTVARVVATEIDPADGGPFTRLRGLSGQQEDVDPPNDNAFARTYQLRSIADAVNALRPFISREAAQQAGHDVNRPFEFRPFTPRLPNPRGGVNG